MTWLLVATIAVWIAAAHLERSEAKQQRATIQRLYDEKAKLLDFILDHHGPVTSIEVLRKGGGVARFPIDRNHRVSEGFLDRLRQHGTPERVIEHIRRQNQRED